MRSSHRSRGSCREATCGWRVTIERIIFELLSFALISSCANSRFKVSWGEQRAREEAVCETLFTKYCDSRSGCLGVQSPIEVKDEIALSGPM